MEENYKVSVWKKKVSVYLELLPTIDSGDVFVVSKWLQGINALLEVNPHFKELVVDGKSPETLNLDEWGIQKDELKYTQMDMDFHIRDILMTKTIPTEYDDNWKIGLPTWNTTPHEVYLWILDENKRRTRDMFAEYFSALKQTFVLPRDETKDAQDTIRLFNHIERFVNENYRLEVTALRMKVKNHILKFKFDKLLAQEYQKKLDGQDIMTSHDLIDEVEHWREYLTEVAALKRKKTRSKKKRKEKATKQLTNNFANLSVSTDPQQIYKLLDAAQSSVRAHIGSIAPRVMIICGSGLGGIADLVHKSIEISYDKIPGFKTSTVPGHAGKLLFGYIGGKKVPVMCMVGRLHFYEGYNFSETTFPIRLAKRLGVSSVIVTNAAGGMNEKYRPGDLMVINDHINLPGLGGYHPLRGPNLEEFGPRFQPLSDAYDLELRRQFLTIAKKTLKLDRNIYEGTYVFAAGPTFETRAEVRMIRSIGGDAVGMSTVPEVIVARHSGMRVLAVSLITNAGVGAKPASALEEQPPLDEGMASHDEVLEAANEASKDVQAIVEEVVDGM